MDREMNKFSIQSFLHSVVCNKSKYFNKTYANLLFIKEEPIQAILEIKPLIKYPYYPYFPYLFVIMTFLVRVNRVVRVFSEWLISYLIYSDLF